MRALVVLAVAAAIASSSAACTTDRPEAATTSPRPVPTLTPEFAGKPTLEPPDMSDGGPGSLIEVTPLKNQNYFDQVDATAVRVVYRSTRGLDGESSEVSGVVAVPAGKPPKGGWPILSFGHAVTGLSSACAPSLADDVAGYAPIIAVMLSRGYVVALSDYEGLGMVGNRHSVIDTATLGNNVVDAVRAARRVVPSASNRWATLGFGEGGQAAWSANERAVSYGSGLELVGSVALAPLVDSTGLVDAAMSGNLIGEQYRLFAQVLDGAAAEDPTLDLDAYRSGLVRDRWSDLVNCGADATAMANTLGSLRPGDLRPPNGAAAAKLRALLARHALPGPGGLAAPLLVVYGTEDPLISKAWVIPSLQRACGKGDVLEIRPQIGASSIESDQILQSSLDWLQARFDGQKLGDVCGAAA
ncbi:lipase family protein [Mycolicibacterium sp.]|uniref:lipase family protein n=1 Tax=Mycolicibacterium sp. TaxID=2320850 RepID=UPI001A2090FD|nr:lipase family protein [Mycolicibacterium sp.]MBJ7339085.1 lipase [Mycolicibacterium sp.]